jgi:hypothetical protein
VSQGSGWQSTIVFEPSLDIGAFVMSNSVQNDPQGFAQSILYKLAQALPPN